MNNKAMKKVSRSMSMCMGVTLSLILSLTGNLIGMVQSGQFNTLGFLLGFVGSTVVSLIIGLVIPMGRIHQSIVKKHGNDIIGRYIESLISDLIYTPILTFLMVLMSYFMMKSHVAPENQPPFLGMFLPSLGICFVVGYILIFILMPVYMRLLMKKYGISPLGPRPPKDTIQ
ncbi:MAG: hypothetical protein J5819_00730 [Eubacterium sp.]|nr:hypothetical protein [Eubacterium sp.]